MSLATEFSTSIREIAGHDIAELVEQFGTPTYVYDAEVIRRRIADLKQFDVIRYAQKANSNLAILDLVRREGVLVDAVSAGEVRRAMAAGYRAGGDPPEIVYTADIFDHDALEICREHRLHVNCGSPDMLTQWGEAAPGSEVTLRINPGFGHGHSQKTNTGGPQSKHGIWHEHLPDCVATARRYDLTIAGLHMHIGSGTDLKHLSQVCGALEVAAQQVGDSITSISAGGGLPTRYKSTDQSIEIDEYFQLWNATRGRLQEALGHAILLEIEPGRYLSAESGWLIAEIRAVKRMGENLFYLVDAGFNNLARPILYGAYHPMAIAPAKGRAVEEQTVEAVVGGPLCESGDIFTQDEGGYVSRRTLPVAKVGDFLVIGCAGAYGFVMGSNYNSKPMAAEVLLEGGQAHVIRARQSFDDLVRGEQIPRR